MSEDSLTASVALAVIGGMLTIIVGGLYAFVSLPTGFEGFASTDFGLIGGLGVLAGIVLLILGVGLIFEPESHTGVGVGLIVVSALTFWGGSWFLPGIILCVAGGLLAIVHEEAEEKVADQRDLLAATRRPLPPQVCPSCGRPVGLERKTCPECGAQLNP